MAQAEYTVIAGPNGSGKSTVLAMLALLGVELTRYHNADDIAAQGLDPQRAQRLVREARDLAIEQGESFTYETVMSHLSHVAAMRRARERGAFVRLIVIATDDPEINVARVANRVRLGGHDVPPDKIRSRYHRVMTETLVPAVDAADEALIFDNSHNGEGQAQIVAHVVGLYAHQYGTPGIEWPGRFLWPRLEAGGRYRIVPAPR